jgi:hypothetical protein
VTQSEKFDPDGAFIRRYLPELAKVPDKYIHAPWTLPPIDQKLAGCVIGRITRRRSWTTPRRGSAPGALRVVKGRRPSAGWRSARCLEAVAVAVPVGFDIVGDGGAQLGLGSLRQARQGFGRAAGQIEEGLPVGVGAVEAAGEGWA